MEQNKTGKPALPAGRYFKYAIGEIILVVIGILIALSINNWNESRTQNVVKQELIASLIEDFEYNKDALKVSRNYADSLFTNMNTFQELIQSGTPLVSVDSLRQLAHSHFRGAIYDPNLTAYEEAKSTGNFSLLNNKTLSELFTVFIRNFENYEDLNDEGRYSYFNGSSWELRKTINLSLISADQSTIDSPLTQTLSYQDYKTMVSTSLAKAALQNSSTLYSNIIRVYGNMDNATTKILELLYEMKEE
ncbi:DUF6090 family protein [Winogradskyella immobilis]|uniref:Uncharacterized protein n=1 Tax=Winogradskyella immobilis TaxID=2816852 RepID=A0ABS8EJG6_9FLAO|nr:DUF6090 family protein [Winogradskyella immobilis]MCC1483334.1 hypothetical protein [Winogradskyella immobilis]MCG0015428.1 hypothetical protein [Winogradskyella immobilis]